jgi:hypothetical protein
MSNRKEYYREPQRMIKVGDEALVMNNELLHSSMRPNFKKQPWFPKNNDNKHRLDLYTQNYQKVRKREQPPLFPPVPERNYPNRNYVADKVAEQSGRFRNTSTHLTKVFEYPVDPIIVSGSNKPFPQVIRTTELTKDELKGTVQPSYELDRTSGAQIGWAPMIMPENRRKRHETVYKPEVGNLTAPLAKQNSNLSKLVERVINRGKATDRVDGVAGGNKAGSYNISVKYDDPKVRRRHEYQPELTNVVGPQATPVNNFVMLREPKIVEYEDNRENNIKSIVYHPGVSGQQVSREPIKPVNVADGRQIMYNKGVLKNLRNENALVQKPQAKNDYINDCAREKSGTIGPTFQLRDNQQPLREPQNLVIKDYVGQATGFFNKIFKNENSLVAKNPLKNDYIANNHIGIASSNDKTKYLANTNAIITKLIARNDYTEKVHPGVASSEVPAQGVNQNVLLKEPVKREIIGTIQPGGGLGKDRIQPTENIKQSKSTIVQGRISNGQNNSVITRPDNDYLVNSRHNRKELLNVNNNPQVAASNITVDRFASPYNWQTDRNIYKQPRDPTNKRLTNLF